MVGTCYVAPVLIPSLGKLTLEEIAKHYNVTEHPLVKSGRLSEADALRNFIAHWHINNKAHTGKPRPCALFVYQVADEVTFEEFKEYYQWISASIDSDEYFELMMRNGMPQLRETSE